MHHRCLVAEAPGQGLDGGRVGVLEGVKLPIMAEERLDSCLLDVPVMPRLGTLPVDMVEGTWVWGGDPEKLDEGCPFASRQMCPCLQDGLKNEEGGVFFGRLDDMGGARHLRWQSRMLACQNEGQNNRHVSVRPTCRRHVGRHVSNMTQKAVGRVTGPTYHSMSLADMSAICRQHDQYLAVGFEPMSKLLFLDSPATLPVRTCVLICRVAGMSSNMSAA
jgi:hypothetical protein